MCSTTFPSAAKEVMADPVHGLPVNSGSVKAPWTCCVSVTVVWFAAAAGVAETTRTIVLLAQQAAGAQDCVPHPVATGAAQWRRPGIHAHPDREAVLLRWRSQWNQ